MESCRNRKPIAVLLASVLIVPLAISRQEVTLSSVRLNPSSVVGGERSTGTVTLTTAAPGDRVFMVLLSSSNPAVVTVPSSVTVPTSATSATFAIGTSSVESTTSVTITATLTVLGTTTRTATLSVTPSQNPAGLRSIVLTPSTVEGGDPVRGTLTLASAAPSSGLVFNLSSSDPAVAVPATVRVAPGATSATFSVTTRAVGETTPVKISGSGGGVTRAATLTVETPATDALSPPSLVAPAADARLAFGQEIVFDWNDVDGAASYTLQIDEEDTFPAPYVPEPKIGASQVSVATLPIRTLWWRVRAHDSAGGHGAWSEARRFEVVE